MADDAGALLVRSGLVSPSALDDARARVANLGGTLGEQLVTTGAIADDALTDFYRSRLLVPQVNPNTLAKLSARVVAAIPTDMAIELRAIPVALDGENNLTVAMSDPSDRHAVDEIAFFTGTYVVRAVASQMQIAWCLAHYYGHVTALGRRLIHGTNAEPQPENPATPATVVPEPAPRAAESPPRTKGLTGKIEAMRHRGVAPQTGPVNPIRPRSGEIALPPVDAAPAPAPVVAEPLRVLRPPDPVEDSDGAPDRSRARSVSGEIRLPGRRAPSIRPPIPEALGIDDESGPIITVEVSSPDEDPTGPRKLPPRRRKAKTDPPELAARAGEVDIHSGHAGPSRSVDDEPRIIIAQDIAAPPPTMLVTERSGELRSVVKRNDTDAPGSSIEVTDDADDAGAGVVIHERLDHESQPILLDRRRPSDPPPADPDSDVVVLADRKRQTRPERRTQVGIGAMPALTRSARDTETEPNLDDLPTGVTHRADDTARVEGGEPPDPSDELAPPPPPATSLDDTNPGVLAPPPRPAPVRAESASGGKMPDGDDDDDDDGPTTSVMSVVELDEAIPQRTAEVVPAHLANRQVEYDSVDDGWGPPGTTIPPPLLGAIPGGEASGVPGQIPISNLDSAPLIVAAPLSPELGSRDTAPLRALEDSTSRLIELIRALEHAHERDGVIDVMIDHLARSHQRAGFFAIKGGELTVFSIQPRPATLPFATLRLDRPSTLQDVVGTRLPYRGPALDDNSRSFFEAALGAAPAEILLVPISVRDRVVGVLFGEHRSRHTFDDQLALAARAAGMALERILKAKRS